MSSNKSFRTKIIGGFNKKDVSSYIEKLYSEFEFKLKEKDEEINKLKSQIKDIKMKYEVAKKDVDKATDDRNKIADVLIKAQEKADNMLEDSRNKAIEEKEKIEELVKLEQEKLKQIKVDLKSLKDAIQLRIREYELRVDDILGEETIESIIENHSEILGKL